jgi:hypothetical protein
MSDSTATVPPTTYAVFRVEPGGEFGAVKLVMLAPPFADLTGAELAARRFDGTTVVIKLSPVGVYRGKAPQ